MSDMRAFLSMGTDRFYSVGGYRHDYEYAAMKEALRILVEVESEPNVETELKFITRARAYFGASFRFCRYGQAAEDLAADIQAVIPVFEELEREARG